MTKHLGASPEYDRPDTPAGDGLLPPTQRDGNTTCELYAPGHQIHYKHQGEAVHSHSYQVQETNVDGSLVTLLLEDGRELHWRHHNSERLGRIVELLRGKGVVYPEFHALRIGPYWFNCASESDSWQECRISQAPSRA